VLVVLAALTLAAACTGAARAAGVGVLWLESGNHTSSARKITSVDRIVIHVTEGSFWGSVRGSAIIARAAPPTTSSRAAATSSSW
jgi:hypothetical protein